MALRKAILYLLALLLPASALLAFPGRAAAAGEKPARFIAVVYDDSGSMRYVNGRDKLKNYIYANYSLQNLAALMDDGDSAKVFLISKKGRQPIDVKKQRDLYTVFKNIGTVKALNTYADTIDAAFKAGASFLQANPAGEFLFVLMTDGDTMYDAKDKEIKGSLRDVFRGYLQGSGLGGLGGRTRALLLSIGADKPLAPVSDLEAALGESGVATQTFIADVTDEAAAGERIMAAMSDLAESMAGTKSMEIEPGKPFTVRYPLESLVIMEQSQQSGNSMIKRIRDASGDDLKLGTLYTTKAIGGLKLASTFSSAASAAGYVKPGTYTLESSGKVRLLAFSKAGFRVNVKIADGSGKTVAEYADNRWSTAGIGISEGERLSAHVTLSTPDGAPVAVGPDMALRFGDDAGLRCEAGSGGAFALEGAKAGQAYLNIGISDPEYFQVALPALGVKVEAAAAAPSASAPSASPSAAPSAAPPSVSASETAQPAPAGAPRKLKLELSAASLEFGVLDGGGAVPACTWRVLAEENGQWTELGAADLPAVQAAGPGGLAVSVDKGKRTLSVRPAWLPALTPVGRSTVTLRVGTGRPGETAEGSVEVTVRDDWRKWLYLALEALAVLLAAAYAAAVAVKKRIPMDLAVSVSPNSDMAFATGAKLERNLARRNFWPFGRETCALGLMELYPHPKSGRHVMLSSECVQYGLRIDGRAPQFHKAKDKLGDFIIGENNIFGIREDGRYWYYRITFTSVRRVARHASAQLKQRWP